MTTGTPQAFALPSQIYFNGGPVTSFNVDCSVLATDGVNPPLILCVTYTYDSTQGPAANVAALKQAIVAGAAANGLGGLTTSNVLVLTAVS
jgi:hypothetical protein